MNIFAKYTLAALRNNRTRTLVTVIGIVLSVAMFTAVTEAVVSLRAYLVRSVEHAVGGYHCVVSLADPAPLSEDGDIKDAVTLGAVGYADIGSENEYKPYLYVAAMSEGFSDLVAVNLVSGRLPQNDGEIAIPSHLLSNGGVKLSEGDVLTLKLGERAADSEKLWQKNEFVPGETLTVRETRTYTVVGFYDRLNYSAEPYSAPGYTALTVGGCSGPYRCFFTFKNVRDAYALEPEINEKYGEAAYNSDLLMMSGTTRYSAINTVMFGFAAVLIALIMFGSVSLIYNSFSISLSERVRQFGILKSIGATKRQIRSAVFYEALFLCAAGIPLGILAGCAGLGVTLFALRDSFNSIIGYTLRNGPELSFVPSAAAMGAAAVIGVLTTFISAIIPAMRAVRVPAIDAVRQTQDFKPKSVKLRTGGLTYKLFGFEGLIAAKNFKRGKRRYRAAVLSLFVSVVLFISASSFCKYITDASGAASNLSEKYDIFCFCSGSAEQNARSFEALSAVDGVTDSALVYAKSAQYIVTPETLTASARKYMADGGAPLPVYIETRWVDDESYKKLTGKTYDPKNPAALLVNKNVWLIRSGEGRLVDIDLLDVRAGGTVTLRATVGGDYSVGTGEDGGLVKFLNDGSEAEFSLERDTQAAEIRVLDVTDDIPFCSTSPAIIYPLSALTDESESEYSGIYFKTKNYKKTRAAIDAVAAELGIDSGNFFAPAENADATRSLVTVVNVFAYGFIILISLIALTNVFNTVSTNIFLRRREIAMYRSVGMTRGGFNRMMNYECVICGARGLMWGLPVSILVTMLMYSLVMRGMTASFYIPWYSIAIAVFSVFFVVFGAMLYTIRKIRKENTIDILRNENV